MATTSKSIRLQLNTKDQKIESVQELVAKVGGLVGCGRCGRIAVLNIETLGDPTPEFAANGVTSMNVEG